MVSLEYIVFLIFLIKEKLDIVSKINYTPKQIDRSVFNMNLV
ncbi:hypothetical protein LEP1GSC074_1292 [Leptospira noguchii str. Hook]|nr:hypothetical protein LEP1GSC170_1550 [Leptospira interrogans serovar Bataviae str. HAI135]EMS82960.1 hypothetical protein LEP1GSC073_0664 [Leptospira noguchii str. Cascata]EMS82975.1 hypothetical protein LEP1GSC074_0728 [Leptospira noguchii str. Hook]EMS87007.1 hypothetical protein LEP1GSC073_3752 [Leptospira noguchii str. Cascata]EMS88857.1 hypothetical protein LEP1GSC074_1292 [Leptospira noguchii str. Hook]